MSNSIRTIARGVAKNRMKEKGYVQFCKRGNTAESPFSKMWRKAVGWHGVRV